MKRACAGVLVLVCFSLQAQQVEPATKIGSISKLSEHVLSPGDSITYMVAEDNAEPKTLKVGSDGNLDIPILGPTYVWQKTINKAAQDIKKALEEKYYQTATVRMSLVLRGGSIYVAGEVNSQGRQEIPPDEAFTLTRAIARAGGLGKFGDGKKVQVRRRKVNGTFETLVVNYDAIIKKGKPEGDIELKHEDYIHVPTKLFNF